MDLQTLASGDTLIISRDALVAPTVGTAISAASFTDIWVNGQVLSVGFYGITGVGNELGLTVGASGIVENVKAGEDAIDGLAAI